jgi:membrane-bound serine protease (ClpP class)
MVSRERGFIMEREKKHIEMPLRGSLFRKGALLVLFASFCPMAANAAAKDAPAGIAQNNPAEKDAPNPEKKSAAWLIRIQLPIDGQTLPRVKRFVKRALAEADSQNVAPVLIFEFAVPKGQENFGRGSDFFHASSLANYLTSEELNRARTVAYLPQSIQGHAVLAAIACQQIVMNKDATIGAAGIDEKTILPEYADWYKTIANRRRTVPEGIALAMLNPADELYLVDTEEAKGIYVDRAGLKELQSRKAVGKPKVVKPAGETAQFTGNEARQMSVASYLAADRRELATALNLPLISIEDDPSLDRPWKAVRVDVKGPLHGDAAERIQRLIEDQIGLKGVNFVCLWIETPGGTALECGNLANFLVALDSRNVRTAAYIPHEARSDAVAIALACDQIVVHPDAILGGSGAYSLAPDEIHDLVDLLRKRVAEKKGCSWSLMAAMIDPRLEVYRCTRLGDVDYFCDEELAAQPDPKQWTKGAKVTTPGKTLQISGTEAVEYRLANRVVNDFQEFRRIYGLDNDPTLVEPGWADALVDGLKSPGMAVLLLVIGFVGLYLEIHSPGVGIGAFIALVCFVLFFWSRYLGGTAGWLEVLLFIAGVSCILLEIFVIPGFGIFGLGGGALVLASIVLASQTFVIPHQDYQFAQLRNSLLVIAGTGMGILAAGYFLQKWLPRTPYANRIILAPPADEEAEAIHRREMLVNLTGLLGQHGATTTPLFPGGKARFGDEIVDVLSDGEVIERGKAVEVVEVRGNRVLVREVL